MSTIIMSMSIIMSINNNVNIISIMFTVYDICLSSSLCEFVDINLVKLKSVIDQP